MYSHVNDVGSALAGFLVSMLFGACFPWPILVIFCCFNHTKINTKCHQKASYTTLICYYNYIHS